MSKALVRDIAGTYRQDMKPQEKQDRNDRSAGDDGQQYTAGEHCER